MERGEMKRGEMKIREPTGLRTQGLAGLMVRRSTEPRFSSLQNLRNPVQNPVQISVQNPAQILEEIIGFTIKHKA